MNVIEKNVITAINNRLESAKTHCQGLHLLFNVLPKLSKENFTKYFPYWMTKVTQILTNARSNSQELLLVCKAISALVKGCKQIAELDKKVSMYNIKQIIGIISERYDHEKNEALINLLTALLYHYPESCARLQVNIFINTCTI